VQDPAQGSVLRFVIARPNAAIHAAVIHADAGFAKLYAKFDSMPARSREYR
jgi:hypothetical protein